MIVIAAKRYLPTAAILAMLAAGPAQPQARAQDGTPGTPGTPAVPPAAAPPPAMPAATQAAGTPPSETPAATQPATTQFRVENDGVVLPNGMILLNFRNASLDAVLSFLSDAGGLTVITAPGVKLEGRLDVISHAPMTIDQALDLLNTLLKDRGFAAVRRAKVVKVVALPDAKKAGYVPVRIGSDPADIPETDEIVTQVMPVRFADATQLKRDLGDLVPDYGNLSANASTNTLVYTATSADVHRLASIVHDLDTSVASVTRVRVFPLKYANATSAARLIADIFKTDQPTQTPGRGGGGGFFQRFAGAMAGGAAPTDPTRPQPKVTASADDRTNTVVVSAPGDVMPVIEEVLKELDANPAANQTVFMYRLRNADATNVQNDINTLFGAGGTGSSPRPNNTPNSVGSGLTGFGASTSGGGRGGTGGAGSTTFGSTTSTTSTTTNRTTTGGAMPSRPGGISASAADLMGQVFAVADTDTNSVLVMTGSANIDRVKQVIAELDRPVPQVLIKALLAEVTHTNSDDLGLEFSMMNNVGNGWSSTGTSFGQGNIITNTQGAPAQPYTPGYTLLNGTSYPAVPYTPAVLGTPAGGGIWSLATSSYSAAVAMLETKGKVDILSRPYILTSDNQQASIIVGQTVPYITGSTTATLTGDVVNTISYQNIGIMLTVTPHINPDGIVTMDVAPQTSSIDQSSSVVIAPGVNATVFNLRSASSRVAVRDGQTIIIGGLMQDQKNETVIQVPLLGDIPWIGNLFKRTQTALSKTELLIFLTPHVAPVPEDLKAMSKDEEKGMKIVPKAVAPGVFQQHLKGLQLGGGAATMPATMPAAAPATDAATHLEAAGK